MEETREISERMFATNSKVLIFKLTVHLPKITRFQKKSSIGAREP